jgi:hypothetical protein
MKGILLRIWMGNKDTVPYLKLGLLKSNVYGPPHEKRGVVPTSIRLPLSSVSDPDQLRIQSGQ